MRGKTIFLMVSILLLLSACSKDEQYWPTDEWKVSSPESQGMDSEILVEMFEHIETDDIGELFGLVVVRNGHIVLESYPSNIYGADDIFNVRSVTKSLLGAVTGIAIEEEVVQLDDKLIDYFPDIDFSSQEKENITMEQLLTMTTGIDWPEWEDSVGLFSEWQLTDDQLKYYLDQPIVEEQIDVFNYDTGAAHTLGTIIENEIEGTIEDYASEKIFDKIGATSVRWNRANEGSTMGGTNVEMTPRDMARFGYLYLQDGEWDGEQIVPKEWVRESLTKQVDAYDDNGYGYYFWISNYEDIDHYIAMGFGGQYIAIVPEYELVVAQTSDQYDFYTLLYDYIIPSIQTDDKIDENKQAYDQLKQYMETDENE